MAIRGKDTMWCSVSLVANAGLLERAGFKVDKRGYAVTDEAGLRSCRLGAGTARVVAKVNYWQWVRHIFLCAGACSNWYRAIQRSFGHTGELKRWHASEIGKSVVVRTQTCRCCYITASRVGTLR